MQNDNYKKRAVDVRRTARASLQELRKARLARRVIIKGTDQAGAHPVDIEVVNELQSTAYPEQRMSTAPARSVAYDELSVVDRDLKEMDDLDALANKNAELDSEDTAMEPASLAPLKDTDQSGLPDQDVAHVALQSDLAKLPGAGPGLVWMLGQCDVKSLAELAVADDIALAEQLGVVGQILDLGQWIKLAQAELQMQ